MKINAKYFKLPLCSTLSQLQAEGLRLTIYTAAEIY